MLNNAAIIGHRGACGYAPENTLAALQKAHALGLKWVEVDIMRTQDGQLVLFHDETLGRTTNGQGLLRDTPYSELAKLDAGSWFAPEFAGERVPTLQQAINYLTAQQMQVNLELKAHPGEEAVFARAMLQALDEAWPKNLPPPLLSSFSYPTLLAMYELHSRYPLAWLIDAWQEDWLQQARAIDAVSVNMAHQLVTRQRVQAIKAEGYAVLSYTVNSQTLADRLFGMGVDGIFTDFGDKIKPPVSLAKRA